MFFPKFCAAHQPGAVHGSLCSAPHDHTRGVETGRESHGVRTWGSPSSGKYQSWGSTPAGPGPNPSLVPLAHLCCIPLQSQNLLVILFGVSPTPYTPRAGNCNSQEASFLSVFEQCEENTNLQDPARYLKFPFSKGLLLGTSSLATKTTKESFWITSFLCSTKLTQNGSVPPSWGAGLGFGGPRRSPAGSSDPGGERPLWGESPGKRDRPDPGLYNACHVRAS